MSDKANTKTGKTVLESKQELSDEEQQPKKKKKKSVVSTVIIVLILLVGVGIMVYPTFSDWWNSFHQSRVIANYATAVDEMDQEAIDALLKEAEEYNKRLLKKGNRYVVDEEELDEYNSILDPSGTGVMGYIEIGSIGVNLPIYHGTSESVLQIAIGHIEGTSLPVGGESTHSALSGHRGLPSAKLFSDLDKVKEGDMFTVTVLNKTITYQVDQIEIVLPEDTSLLNITAGEDYCTLITCTPYGINTHRMMVRGKRVGNLEGEVVILPGGLLIPIFIVIPAVVIPLIFIELILLLIYYRRKKPTMSRLQGQNLLVKLHNDVRTGKMAIKKRKKTK